MNVFSNFPKCCGCVWFQSRLSAPSHPPETAMATCTLVRIRTICQKTATSCVTTTSCQRERVRRRSSGSWTVTDAPRLSTGCSTLHPRHTLSSFSQLYSDVVVVIMFHDFFSWTKGVCKTLEARTFLYDLITMSRLQWKSWYSRSFHICPGDEIWTKQLAWCVASGEGFLQTASVTSLRETWCLLRVFCSFNATNHTNGDCTRIQIVANHSWCWTLPLREGVSDAVEWSERTQYQSNLPLCKWRIRKRLIWYEY